MTEPIVVIAERYINLYGEIRKKTGDDRVAQAILAEVAKDRRMQEMREEREARNGELATAKQLQYLENLGVKVKPGLTKKEASALIDEAVEKED
jgi:hypothetical protein